MISKFHLNRVHTFVELLLGRERPTNVPFLIMHEPTTLCNLECPACPTGEKLIDIKERARHDHFRTVLREFEECIDTCYLYNWGEPTMSKEFADILRLLSGRPFTVAVSTNFSVPLKDDALNVIACMPNLDLKIDLDGSEQKTIEKYRKNASAEIIFSNLRRLAKAVRESETRPKRIYIQMLKFNHNQHQVEDVSNIAKACGFDFFVVNEPLTAEGSSGPNHIKLFREFGCTWLYAATCISPELTHMAPCCGVWARSQFDEIEDKSLYDSYKNGELIQARRRHDKTFLMNPDRAEILRVNSTGVKGMQLDQLSLNRDICEKCAMGQEYQAKAKRIIMSAIDSFSTLTGGVAQIGQRLMTEKLPKFVAAGATNPLYERLISSLEMPQPLYRRT